MQDASSQMTALSTAYPATSPGLGGLCLPGVACRGQSTSPPQGRDPAVFAPPTAMATGSSGAAGPGPAHPGPSQVTREDCEAPLPGATSHAEVQAPPTLAIRSRQANAMPATIGIPIPSRREEEQVNYVTETVTTPERKGRRPPAPGPVPLLSFKSNASISSERGVAPYSRSKSSGALSGDIPHATPTSSFSSVHTVTSTFVSKQMTSTSFRWAPGDALVHCWHRKLSDTYQDYNMVNLVGEGRNGAVFIVQHKVSEQYYACKVLHKAEQDSSALRAEIKNLRMLDHPNVVRLYEVNEDAEAVFLLMEYCCGGDLFSLVTESPKGHLPENVARSFAEQMLNALAYCHSMGIVHRDVKPENFLLEGRLEEDAGATLKLADFGIATHIRCPESQGEGQVNGSVPYMAPELFSKRWSSLVRDSQGDRHALAASDLWSCAIVIYVMLSGDLPYGSDEYRIASGEPPDFSKEVWQTVSPEAIDLIRKLLQPEVEERWTAPQALRHEWFTAKTTRASPESLGNRSIFTERSEGLGFTQSSLEFARAMLRSLRRWRQHPFLRRMVIAGIAKRMEADNPSRKFAETAYQAFKGSQDKLRNDQLVQVLNSAFCGSSPPPDASCSSQTTASNESFLQAGESVRTTRSNSSAGSAFSPGGRSVTGLYVRQHMKQSFRKFMRRLDEDSTLGSSPVSLSPGFPTPGSEVANHHSRHSLLSPQGRVAATSLSTTFPRRRHMALQNNMQRTVELSEGMGMAAASTSLTRAGLEVELVPCLGDNYCPLIHHTASGATFVMDTPEAGPIERALRKRGWTLTHILNTHYHSDHVGGNLELKAEFPQVTIVGHRSIGKEIIPGVDREVAEGDEVLCGALRARVLEVGGHTVAHIAYFFEEVPMALTGDALFTMGCGRVFTGNFAQMQASLNKLRQLPDETVVFCSHEYTLANAKFAAEVEPENSALKARKAQVRTMRDASLATVPTLLGYEKATNPFLRWDVPAVQEAAGGLSGAVDVFTALRKWKDTGIRPRTEARL
ncbi:gloB [Symbiodinium microadriaticum]|nr:gloB [Symbiodinium microadriaticum]CAE7915674.1 gloB [Symbiodinium sp. KB8]